MNLLTLDSLTSHLNVNLEMSEKKKKTVIASFAKDN